MKRSNLILGVVIALLGAATVAVGVQQWHIERCVREATAERADANQNDWQALDALIGALVDDEGTTEAEFNAFAEEYFASRETTDELRAETRDEIRGACGG